MTDWLPRVTAGGGPKYLAIVEALAADVREGRLEPGQRLPPQRLLAERLNVDLTTVTRAFNEARRRNLIDAAAGRGSFVRALPPAAETAGDAAIDMSMNAPPQPAWLAERLAATVREVLAPAGGSLRLHYQDSAGTAADRAAGAVWLGRQLGPTSPERVLVAAGAQNALHAVLATLLRPGDMLCAGALTYPGLRAVAERQTLRILPIPLDADGLDAAAFGEACRRHAPRVLYVVPTLHNPTTTTMPAARREAIVATARRYGVTIVEDDAYGTLPAAAPPPLAALAPDIVWHVATLSKCATPALRLAYVAVPGLEEALQLAAEARSTILMAPPLMAAVASRWILDGTLAEMGRAIRAENVARQGLARRVLQGANFAAQAEGAHLWLRLPGRRGELVTDARCSGLAIVPSDAFVTGDAAPEAVRVSLGIAADRAVLERGLRLLAALLGRRPAAAIV